MRASHGEGVTDQFEVVGIDAAPLLEERPLHRVRRVVQNLGKDRGYPILTLEGNDAEEDAAKAFVGKVGLNVGEIRKLSRRIDEPVSQYYAMFGPSISLSRLLNVSPLSRRPRVERCS